jgi:hypothetical protein
MHLMVPVIFPAYTCDYACNAFIMKVHLMVAIIFPAYTCQLGSTPLVKRINVIHFKKLFGHFSCDTNLFKTYRSMG